MRGSRIIGSTADWSIILLYLLLVFMGWMNIYAAVYDDTHRSIFDTTQQYGKQLIWIISSLVIGASILVVDHKFYTTFAYGIYGIIMLLLIVVLLAGTEISGSRSWFEIGSFRLQPSEFAKFATALALAKYLSTLNINLKNFKTKIVAGAIILLPVVLILLQNDTGSALVYAAFIFVLYREGLSRNFLLLVFVAGFLFVMALMIDRFTLIATLLGLGAITAYYLRKNKKQLLAVISVFVLACLLVFSVDYFYNSVLKTHQQNRIDVLLGKSQDIHGVGYNVNQSLIAIGSGGFAGKGYLKGTQTKFDFVPEQSTDFIFCTVGEEWGFVGSFIVIVLFTTLLLRIIVISERQRSSFARIYGYGVASILFFHMMVNIGMTIGLAPVIGIPLPFFSYGGSSLWSFTILLFILLKLDSVRKMVLR